MRCEHFNASSGQLSARVCGNGFERLLHSALEPEQERNWFRPNSLAELSLPLAQVSAIIWSF
ncbi:MAG: hypothetical protein FWF63_09635 [Fibromonadales bacterium]|nr:hypothetical protein [Fibromonadales bacterium]